MKFKSNAQRKAVMANLNNSKSYHPVNRKPINTKSNPTELTEGEKKRFERILNNSDIGKSDEQAVRELDIHKMNDQQLYNMQTAIVKNLEKKRDKGTYNKAGGVLAFKNLADQTAKSYQKTYGGGKFDTVDRNVLAIRLEKQFRNRGFEGTY